MVVYWIIVAIFIVFSVQRWMNLNTPITSSIGAKPPQYAKIFFFVAPICAVIVFAVLFSAVLTERLSERSSHALIVLMLWLYSASFYADAVFFGEKKFYRLCCIFFVIITAGMAILLSPLDHYVTLLDGFVPIGVYGIGICMLLVYYISLLLSYRRK
ncbi:MAG: hypothetical protein FWC16_14425 [Defluviitaleaceae bacterium]|nr:hypothetical protein [Defluviitaleaceae bacterium]MCL2276110.1 hypothetical protein [Defluviitaleaceae bacterium]